MKVRVAAVAASLVIFAPGSRAVTPDEMLKDPRLEERARDLSQGLRCVVCQNQSIDDSNAPLAHDLRVLLRERLVAGDSDKAAVDYIVARYGNFVLLKPPMQPNTVALWCAPALVGLLALFGFSRYLGRSRAAPSGPSPTLTVDEETRADALLEGKQIQ
ncbi:cytochrome C biogenesis protein [Methylocystis bryophila]|uniref:Cytochrome c-type biogenesis protein n=1 Tax=Methylocystis bryophila TaxID=655015 RepID=A0A1W6N202_9HYPH|nr:cytochrome C biogenesis protein [Methylocystis bryophila]